MSNVLIPFAIHSLTGKIVSICDVESGLACSCTCPSCGARLIAKKNSSQRVDHFAHHDGSSTTCELSFETSIRLMLLESVHRITQIVLPRLVVETNAGRTLLANGGRYAIEKCDSVELHNEPQFLISFPQTDKKIALFIPPAKEQFPPLWTSAYIAKNPNTGLLIVSLTSLGVQLLGELKAQRTRKPDEILLDLISTTSDHLSWIFHPRQRSINENNVTIRQHQRASDPVGIKSISMGDVENPEVERLFCKHCFLRSEHVDNNGLCFRKICISSRNAIPSTTNTNAYLRINDTQPIERKPKSSSQPLNTLKKGGQCPRCGNKVSQVGKILICNHCGLNSD